jgi:nucleotide-binding universal stress UspA family protein
MHETSPRDPAVIVGIDGSRKAVDAALWAVDEAAKRNLPLRLTYAIEPTESTGTDSEAEARAFATAEAAVRYAAMAIESLDIPVKIEVAIRQGRPTDVLREASHAAAMLCIGAVGLRHATSGDVGSTASALAAWAHCPVAVIRGHVPPPTVPTSVLVEVDRSPEGDMVLQQGVDEALLRGASLVAVSAWQPRVTDVHDAAAVAEQNRLVRGELNRRLERAKCRHPGLDAQSVVANGSLLDYLSHHSHTIQLVVISRRRARGIAEVVGPPSHAALRDTDCCVLVCASSSSL